MTLVSFFVYLTYNIVGKFTFAIFDSPYKNSGYSFDIFGVS